MENQSSFWFAMAAAVSGAVLMTTKQKSHAEHNLEKHKNNDEEEEFTDVLNWSGTHATKVPTLHYHEPESVQELEKLVKECHEKGIPMRPVGSALSPNGLSFQNGGMISLTHLDKVVKVDEEQMTVTVQAGARVSQVIDALRPYNLTLPNLASIAEQQMGGFIQVGAHGTGATIPPVDDFVLSLSMVTPAHGLIHFAKSKKNPIPFDLVKVGLGCLGIVTEITMQCIPAHKLVEHTFVLTREEAHQQLDGLLKMHKHIRYMWIPYEDAVVVVTNDPEQPRDTNDHDEKDLMGLKKQARQFVKEEQERTKEQSIEKKRERFAPLVELLNEVRGEVQPQEEMDDMGFGEMRDALLAYQPLDFHHVKRCNKAEAEFWKRSEGYQIRPSDELLQFDCGGQQWVYEVCFPTGTYSNNTHQDLEFMTQLLHHMESRRIPAPAPIEQRWTSSSSSYMSPAYGHARDGLHTWVGIIMYLPTDDVQQRKEIENMFRGVYCEVVKEVAEKVGVDVVSHWAKLEWPPVVREGETEEAAHLRVREGIVRRYPVEFFNEARVRLDPKNLLANDWANGVFGRPRSK